MTPLAASTFQLPADARLNLTGLALCAGTLHTPGPDVAEMLARLPSTTGGEALPLAHACLGHAGCRAARHGTTAVALVGEAFWLDRDDEAATPTGIAEAYGHSGEALLERLGGHFALAIADEGAGAVLLAVDRLGREPLYWHGDDSGLVAASTADGLLGHPSLTATLSHQGLFHYLFFHMVPGPDSIYTGVHKLPAAHYLHWRAGRLDLRCYWVPEFQETAVDRESLRAGVLGSLRSAVARQSTGDDTGAFLSGGLDSSTVTGLLAGLQPGADAYSIGFDAEGYDEISYARLAARHFGVRGHEHYVTPDDVLAALPLVAQAYDEPFGNSSALPALFCAALARYNGKHRLLAGDGGDEIYAGNSRYAKQQVFEIFQRLPAALRALLEASTAVFPEGAPLLGKARSYVTQARVPLPDRLHSYNHVQRLGATAMFSGDFLAAVDTQVPGHLERTIYERPQGASTLNRMLYLDWHHTLADNDLRKVGRMCALAGMQVRYPMLDDAVISHSLRVPSRLKLKGGRLRDFYKRSTAGFLPEAIIDKPKHGFGLPFGIWMAEHPGLRELAGDNLQRLRRRGILREDFIDQALRLHQESHAAYYGELVWVMLVLELWLTSRGFEP